MNWCQRHWDQLRQAIIDRGLDGFGAQNGEEAAKSMQSQLAGEEEAFDPLLGSWTRLNLAMAESLHGQGRHDEIVKLRCPMCILIEDGQPELVENWINGVTDSAKAYAIEQGLIKADA